MPGSRTQKQASSHPSRRESSRTSLPCALQSRTLGQTARSKGRLRNSNLSNDKCMGARKLTFSKHDCSVQHDPRRRHQTCVRAQSGPRGKGPQWLPSSHGSRGWDAGGGDDCEDPSRLFCSWSADQGDLPRAWRIAQSSPQGHPFDATEFRYERETQPLPKMGPWSAELDRLLAANESKVARERLTLIRLFEELRGLGYVGGYDAVRRYARRWSQERGQSTTAAYVPLSFAPGEAYQFDW